MLAESRPRRTACKVQRFLAFAFGLLLACSVSAEGSGLVELESPNGEVLVALAENSGRLYYRVAYRGEAVIRSSPLGMLFRDAPALLEDMSILDDVQRSSHDEVWEQPWGEDRLVRDHHNEMLVTARHGPSGAILQIRVRAFDDGVGFRYEVPEQAALGEVNITRELTGFVVPSDVEAWWIPGDQTNRYEYLYRRTGVEAMDQVHTPVTFRLPSGTHFSIHEAALVDYSGMTLKQTWEGSFRATLRPWSDGVLVKTQTPFVSPWRTIQVSPDAVGLINSRLILNLNEPNALGDVSWVEPTKYVGIWWAMHINERTWGHDRIHGASTEETMRYMDFAAEHGFGGVLVEGWNLGWDVDWQANGEIFSFTESYPDFDLERVTRYGNERGAPLIGHHETSGNVSNSERQLEDAFDLYERLGVKAVKTGYVAGTGWLRRKDEQGITRFEYHDGQFAVEHHLKVVKEAAKHGISINPHEPVKDTGLRRTYPNWLTREGARGQEYNAWGNPPNPPEHTAILPYTRMLSGPMDFTPGIFDLRPSERPPARDDMPRHSPKSRIETTLAKQLSLYVVLYSPLQMAADLPENYEARPYAFQFIKDVPVDLEDSLALAGEIGDYLLMARKDRASDDWYVGALTDESARELELDLGFLDQDGRYRATLYLDGDDAHWLDRPYEMKIEEREVSAVDSLHLKLAPGGGAAIRIAKR